MTWENKLKENITTIRELKKYIELSVEEEKLLREVVREHPMRITKYYLSLISKEKDDPLRKLVVPSVEELNLEGDYDTSGEIENTMKRGLQHKYKQTVLILATNRCASYCRFCFRKRLIGLSSEEIVERFDDAVDYIREHKEINNVLISGGDPFILPTRIIERFLKRLVEIKHLDFIRFGTRILVVFPDRILDDDFLLDLLKKYSSKKKIYVVTHFNHPREITEKAIRAVNKLLNCGISISNQTVLLRGVNDNADVLVELQKKLVGIGIVPYYFFQCRPVKRVKNYFQVPLYEGYEIIEGAKRKVDGYSKRFRYVMSHKTGKIEILGKDDNFMYFKYHQAKDPNNMGRFFKKKLDKKACWLDDFS